tara:strand:- start:1177 stop:1305 length:129 start_codon:yes stop_codon:yes gene_type:complete
LIPLHISTAKWASDPVANRIASGLSSSCKIYAPLFTPSSILS